MYFRAIFFLFSILFVGVINAAEKIDLSLKTTKAGVVNITVPAGDIKVEAWDKLDVSVAGNIDEDLKEPTFVKEGNTIKFVLSSEGNSYSQNNKTKLTFRIPATNSLRFNGVSTDIEVKGVQADIDLSTVSGDVIVSGSRQELKINSVSGDAGITDSSGIFSLQTVSSDVHAKINATEFKAATTSGDLDVELGDPKVIDLQSVSGDLSAKLELADEARLSAQSISGDMTLKFKNKNLNAKFDIETGPGGDVNNKLSQHEAEESFIGADELHFTLGKGSGHVELETLSGDITLKK